MHTPLPYTPRMATPDEIDELALRGKIFCFPKAISGNAFKYRAWFLHYAPTETGEDANQLLDDWLEFATEDLKLPLEHCTALEFAFFNI